MLMDKSSYKKCTFSLPPDLIERMDVFSNKTGITKSKIIISSVEKYLDDNNANEIAINKGRR